MDLQLFSFSNIIIPLSVALGLSLAVERIIEILKNFFETALSGKDSRKIPKLSEAQRHVNNMEKMYQNDNYMRETEEKIGTLRSEIDKEKDPKRHAELLYDLQALEKDVELDERFSSSTILVEAAKDPDKGQTLKYFIIQLLGFSIAIILTRISKLQLFNSFIVNDQLILPWLDYLMTGLLIGGGSKPIHVLVRFITQRKIVSTQTTDISEEQEKTPQVKKVTLSPIVSSPTVENKDAWIEIPYNGGVDRDVLESVHKRKSDPNMIIYHHTAMNLNSTFEDVVRVLKVK